MSYIGLDIGTSSLKAILLDSNNQVVKSVTTSYPINYFNEGWSEQNPVDWFDATISVLKELLLFDCENVKAISFSGQMHGLVSLDSNDKVIRPAILWNDQRTTNECDYLNNVVGKQKLREETGNIALTGYTLPKILWMRNNELENYNKIDKVMLPKDYVSYMLTGIFASDVSDLSGTLMFDVKNRDYSDYMIKVSGLDKANLPKVYESNEIVGYLRDEIKSILNIKYDIAVVIGGGDQAIGAIGTGTIKDGDINLSLGTSGVVYVAKNKFSLPDNEIAHSFCDATSNYLLMGVALSTGASMKWFYEDILGKLDYSKLDELLHTSSSKPIYFLPYLTGERSPINDPLATGLFYGLNSQTTQIDMMRAVVEGTSFSLKHILDSLEILNVNNCKITGGGSKNKYWVNTISNVMGCEVNTITIEECPALGAAIIAKSGFENVAIESICSQIIDVKEKISPNTSLLEKYSKWVKIYPIVKEIEL